MGSIGELVQIFQKHDHAHANLQAWKWAIIADIMRWHEEKPARMWWCNHIKWNGTYWQFGEFCLRNPDHYGWRSCPVCGKKKPTEIGGKDDGQENRDSSS
jgi:hypothetical protein